MTRGEVSAWLNERHPAPPSDLATKLAECVESAPDSIFGGDSVAAVTGALGVWLLQSAVHDRKVAYDTAMDLLAGDAFVTYAFEAASEEGTDVTGLAHQLLTAVRA